MAFPEEFRSAANQDISTLSVVELINQHDALRDTFNAYLESAQTSSETAPEPAPAEQIRAQELWKELLRRAIADDSAALEAVIKRTDESTPMTRERIEALLRSEDSFGDAS
ncbi:MAG: hypothetical protein KBD05_00025 [Candidatus Pacebacteria bacterium]|nr:hypothetical protein [Candidatus Paceibacterota bacterium]